MDKDEKGETRTGTVKSREMKKFTVVFILSFLICLRCSNSSNEINSTQNMHSKDNDMTYPVKNISVSIARPADAVYLFASNPENFPNWVAFVKSITKQGEFWIGQTELGEIKFKFSPQNNFYVLDHQVILSSGETVNNPLRVVANNNGCEVIFTLFRLPNRTDEEFNAGARAVAADLQKLKTLMEKN